MSAAGCAGFCGRRFSEAVCVWHPLETHSCAVSQSFAQVKDASSVFAAHVLAMLRLVFAQYTLRSCPLCKALKDMKPYACEYLGACTDRALYVNTRVQACLMCEYLRAWITRRILCERRIIVQACLMCEYPIQI